MSKVLSRVKPSDAERARCEEMMRDPLAVFVFGSNRRGVHGGGAAAVAQRRYGAKRGVGEGPNGRSYAIPTKETWRDAGLPLSEIAIHVATFLDYARQKWCAAFVVTRVGCGLAGYSDADIAPLFADAPPNCFLPDGWRSTTRREVIEDAPVKYLDKVFESTIDLTESMVRDICDPSKPLHNVTPKLNEP